MGEGARPGPVVARRPPLGGAGGAVRGAQIARAARASFPLGIPYCERAQRASQGVPGEGVPRGRGAAGETASARGQGVLVDGPGADREQKVAPRRAPLASCTIVALATESCPRRFPGSSVTRRAPRARGGHRPPRCRWRRVHGAWRGAREMIVALGAAMAKRTGPCQRELEAAGAHTRSPVRARARPRTR